MDSSSPSTKKSLFRGDLAQTPVPEVLATIHKYRVPGFIECVRGTETKRVYIDEGNIIFASSTRTDDSLGDRLLAQGKITPEQYAESVRRLSVENGKRQGVILVEMRAIEPKDLFVAVREQVQSVVWSLFDWTEGTIIFEPGREKHLEFIKLNISTRQAVLQGVRSMTDARRLVARMGKKTTVLQKLPNGDYSNLVLSTEEQGLLNQIDGKKALVDLIAIPPLSPAENAKVLYAFFALKLVGIKEPKQIKVQVRV